VWLTEILMRTSVWLSMAAYLTIGSIVPTALAASPFQGLLGAWSGSGQIRYGDGSSERVRCSAYYSEAGRSLRLAIRCRSAANQVEIRGLLTRQGGLLVGTWEERTFNVSGDASGRMTSGRINLSIMGGGFAGSMSVAYSGSRQSVVISIQGMSMQGVNITLTRS
jgi:hypothetical protein